MPEIDDTLTMTVLPVPRWDVTGVCDLIFSWMDRFGGWVCSLVSRPGPKERPLGVLTQANLNRLTSMREKNQHSDVNVAKDLASHNQLSQRLQPILAREKVCIFRAAAEKMKQAQAQRKGGEQASD